MHSNASLNIQILKNIFVPDKIIEEEANFFIQLQ